MIFSSLRVCTNVFCVFIDIEILEAYISPPVKILKWKFHYTFLMWPTSVLNSKYWNGKYFQKKFIFSEIFRQYGGSLIVININSLTKYNNN